MSELKRNFRPEFLNRVDEVIVFHSLTKKEIKKIVDLMFNEVKELLKEKEIKLEVSEEAKDLIVKEGYDPDFGARPLRRAIQRLIENPLSEKILEGKFKQGDTVTVKIKEGSIVLKKKEELAGALSR
jgi:ATP-dependent Clp protease ATP-binding subunit ClpC